MARRIPDEGGVGGEGEEGEGGRKSDCVRWWERRKRNKRGISEWKFRKK